MLVFRKRRSGAPLVETGDPGAGDQSEEDLMREIRWLQEDLNSELWRKHETKKAELEALASSQMAILSRLTSENQALAEQVNEKSQKTKPSDEEEARVREEVEGLSAINTENVKKVALECGDAEKIVEFRKARLREAREFYRNRGELAARCEKFNAMSAELFERRAKLGNLEEMKAQLASLLREKQEKTETLDERLRQEEVCAQRCQILQGLQGDEKRVRDLLGQIEIVKNLIDEIRSGKIPRDVIQSRIRNDFMADAQQTQESQRQWNEDSDDASFKDDEEIQRRIRELDQECQEIAARVTEKKAEAGGYIHRIAEKSQQLSQEWTRVVRFWDSL